MSIMQGLEWDVDAMYHEFLLVNMDVTAMIAYVTNLTNGNRNFAFSQQALTMQTVFESIFPMKPNLEKLFKGKGLICCQSAWRSFERVLFFNAGPMEASRAEALKKKITIYPDDFAGPDDFVRNKLVVGGYITQAAKTIFNFGQRMKALTVTANEQFVSAALQQGATYAVFLHQPRALTEMRESTAERHSTYWFFMYYLFHMAPGPR